MPAPEPATTVFVTLSEAVASISIFVEEMFVFEASASMSLLTTSVPTVAPTLVEPEPDTAPEVMKMFVVPLARSAVLSPAIKPVCFLPDTSAFAELSSTSVSTAPETATAPEP